MDAGELCAEPEVDGRAGAVELAVAGAVEGEKVEESGAEGEADAGADDADDFFDSD